LRDNIKTNLKFNLSIFDDSCGWKPSIGLKRHRAVPYLKNLLAEEFLIYLDDTNRKGEKEVMSLWNQKYKLRFERINNTAVVCINGNKLNTIL